MEILLLILPIFLIASILVCTALLIIGTKPKETYVEKRKRQARSLLTENVIRKKLTDYAEEKVSKTKQAKIEEMCRAAGKPMKFADFLMISIIAAILLFAFALIALNNPLLAVLFLVLGAMAPYEYMQVKRNKRMIEMDNKVGPLLQLLVERYMMSKDMRTCIDATCIDFKGEEPLYSELLVLKTDIDAGKDVVMALKEFAARTDNTYLIRFAEFYEIAATIGNEESINLLKEPKKQFDEDRELNLELKKSMKEVKLDAYVVLGTIPAVVVYQIFMDPGYINFMTNTTVGQIGSFAITAVFISCLWVVTKVLGAPLK